VTVVVELDNQTFRRKLYSQFNAFFIALQYPTHDIDRPMTFLTVCSMFDSRERPAGCICQIYPCMGSDFREQKANKNETFSIFCIMV